MGQKVNPNGLRLGIIKDWKSQWYSDDEYKKYLSNDIKIRDFISVNLKDAAVSKVLIERKKDRCDIKIFSAKPGIIIGQGGKDIEKLRNRIKKIINEDVYITIVEEKKPDLNAKLVADSIAKQIENRANFRNVQKRAIKSTMKAGALGIKTSVSGRLGGVEMARTEGYTEGTVPLHTIRADIDYATSRAYTTYGIIGVKVWIYKGEILPDKKQVKGGNEDGINAKEN